MACCRTIRYLGLRVPGLRHGTAAMVGLAVLIGAIGASAQSAPPLKAGVSVSVDGGYARLIFTATGYIDATARVAGNVLIINFQQPIAVSVARIPDAAPAYIGAARTDPDGKAIRMALERPVTLNAMAAGEKFFVDLLPDTWTGVPPGLPQDVVDGLARRAREADQLLQRQRQLEQQKRLARIRVHVATQPTFTRYTFDVGNDVSVSADRSKDRLVLNFDAPLTFDLADAQAALPKPVEDISSEMEDDSALVRFVFGGKADVRTFRDESGYVVDLVTQGGTPGSTADAVVLAQLNAAMQAPKSSPPATEAAKAAVPAAAAPPAQAPQPAIAPAPTAAAPTPPIAAAEPPQLAEAPATVPAVRPGNAPPPTAAASVAEPPTAAPPLPPVAPPKPPAPVAAASAPVLPPAAAASDGDRTPAPPPPAVSPPPPDSDGTDPPPPPAATQQPAPAAANEPPAPRIIAPTVAKADPPGAAAPSPPSAPEAAKPDDRSNRGVVAAEIARDGTSLKLSLPFAAATAAAVFSRADTLWLVFDSNADIDLSALDGDPGRTVRNADFTRTADADILRLKLDRPHLVSVTADGAVWTVEIADSILEPTRPLELTRNVIGPNRSSVVIPFDGPHQLHRLADPEVGDSLLVVTGFAPARGFIDQQDFIEFRALASSQGVVIDPIADDVNVQMAFDKIVVGRPSGLTLSTSLQTLLHGAGLRPMMFDSQVWGFDRDASYLDRQAHLITTAAAAPENKRLAPRLDLARFYLARDMYEEAKGVLDVAIADNRSTAEVGSAIVLRAIAEVMINRPEDALRDLADPVVGDQHDAPLWRALAYARQGKWAQARDGFKAVEAEVATLPLDLQRIALKEEMRSAIETRDLDGASSNLNDFETIGVPHDMEPTIAVLMGRLAEALGHNEDALAAYRTAADSWDRPAAAQGQLRETALRYRLGDLKREEVITQLESLTTIWRGDETEIEALKILAHLYTEDGRYRDAFYVMRSAMSAHPDSAMTRQIQDEAAATFDSLFLAGKGDAMPAIDALALFYDFRELTPVGARGDEMIRRLADRLVSVDLLDQAADLLQYQVDHRLQGAARAQVATRLAVIYLMNRKADRALAVLRTTRTADLSNELRTQRLLLEARALSDTGRHDLALEVVNNLDGREAIHLRSDILWAARRWGQSAEQIELMYGDRYKDFRPLNDVERQDILRAEIGFALAEDQLGLGRFREKYAAKMAQTPDAHAFEVVSAPLGTSGLEFGAIAHAATSVDTMEGFLRDMKARYPDAVAGGTPSPAADPAPAVPPFGSPAAGPSASAKPPGPRPLAAPKPRGGAA